MKKSSSTVSARLVLHLIISLPLFASAQSYAPVVCTGPMPSSTYTLTNAGGFYGTNGCTLLSSSLNVFSFVPSDVVTWAAIAKDNDRDPSDLSDDFANIVFEGMALSPFELVVASPAWGQQSQTSTTLNSCAIHIRINGSIASCNTGQETGLIRIQEPLPYGSLIEVFNMTYTCSTCLSATWTGFISLMAYTITLTGLTIRVYSNYIYFGNSCLSMISTTHNTYLTVAQNSVVEYYKNFVSVTLNDGDSSYIPAVWSFGKFNSFSITDNSTIRIHYNNVTVIARDSSQSKPQRFHMVCLCQTPNNFSSSSGLSWSYNNVSFIAPGTATCLELLGSMRTFSLLLAGGSYLHMIGNTELYSLKNGLTCINYLSSAVWDASATIEIIGSSSDGVGSQLRISGNDVTIAIQSGHTTMRAVYLPQTRLSITYSSELYSSLQLPPDASTMAYATFEHVNAMFLIDGNTFRFNYNTSSTEPNYNPIGTAANIGVLVTITDSVTIFSGALMLLRGNDVSFYSPRGAATFNFPLHVIYLTRLTLVNTPEENVYSAFSLQLNNVVGILPTLATSFTSLVMSTDDQTVTSDGREQNVWFCRNRFNAIDFTALTDYKPFEPEQILERLNLNCSQMRTIGVLTTSAPTSSTTTTRATTMITTTTKLPTSTTTKSPTTSITPITSTTPVVLYPHTASELPITVTSTSTDAPILPTTIAPTSSPGKSSTTPIVSTSAAATATSTPQPTTTTTPVTTIRDEATAPPETSAAVVKQREVIKLSGCDMFVGLDPMSPTKQVSVSTSASASSSLCASLGYNSWNNEARQQSSGGGSYKLTSEGAVSGKVTLLVGIRPSLAIQNTRYNLSLIQASRATPINGTNSSSSARGFAPLSSSSSLSQDLISNAASLAGSGLGDLSWSLKFISEGLSCLEVTARTAALSGTLDGVYQSRQLYLSLNLSTLLAPGHPAPNSAAAQQLEDPNSESPIYDFDRWPMVTIGFLLSPPTVSATLDTAVSALGVVGSLAVPTVAMQQSVLQAVARIIRCENNPCQMSLLAHPLQFRVGIMGGASAWSSQRRGSTTNSTTQPDENATHVGDSVSEQEDEPYSIDGDCMSMYRGAILSNVFVIVPMSAVFWILVATVVYVFRAFLKPYIVGGKSTNYSLSSLYSGVVEILYEYLCWPGVLAVLPMIVAEGQAVATMVLLRSYLGVVFAGEEESDLTASTSGNSTFAANVSDTTEGLTTSIGSSGSYDGRSASQKSADLVLGIFGLLSLIGFAVCWVMAIRPLVWPRGSMALERRTIIEFGMARGRSRTLSLPREGRRASVIETPSDGAPLKVRASPAAPNTSVDRTVFGHFVYCVRKIIEPTHEWRVAHVGTTAGKSPPSDNTASTEEADKINSLPNFLELQLLQDDDSDGGRETTAESQAEDEAVDDISDLLDIIDEMSKPDVSEEVDSSSSQNQYRKSRSNSSVSSSGAHTLLDAAEYLSVRAHSRRSAVSFFDGRTKEDEVDASMLVAKARHYSRRRSSTMESALSDLLTEADPRAHPLAARLGHMSHMIGEVRWIPYECFSFAVACGIGFIEGSDSSSTAACRTQATFMLLLVALQSLAIVGFVVALIPLEMAFISTVAAFSLIISLVGVIAVFSDPSDAATMINFVQAANDAASWTMIVGLGLSIVLSIFSSVVDGLERWAIGRRVTAELAIIAASEQKGMQQPLPAGLYQSNAVKEARHIPEATADLSREDASINSDYVVGGYTDNDLPPTWGNATITPATSRHFEYNPSSQGRKTDLTRDFSSFFEDDLLL